MLQTLFAFEAAHYQAQLAWLASILPSLVVALTNFPKVAKGVGLVLKVLDVFSVLSHKDSPGTLKLPFTQSKPPAVIGQPIASTSSATIGKIAILGIALLCASAAHAQTFSAGLSVPLLEFKVKGSQPVQFAPGTGLEASVGFFDTTIVGQTVQLLTVGAAAFATAPGSLQMALMVGTLNNMVGIGAAVPLAAADGSGAFQGSFNVYPLLTGAVPFSLYSSPTDLTALELAGGVAPRKRFGTIYLGLLPGHE